MDAVILVAPITLLFSAIGLTFLFKTYLENLVSGFIIRRAGDMRRGTRIKLLISPQVIKGDVVSVGPVRTTLIEVGDGEHLPSIQTGRFVKIPNTMLVGGAIVLYRDTMVDEVIAEVKLGAVTVEEAIGTMRKAIEEVGHTPLDVGIYQKSERLVVHGVFEVRTRTASDERGRVLRRFLELVSAETAAAPVANGANGVS